MTVFWLNCRGYRVRATIRLKIGCILASGSRAIRTASEKYTIKTSSTKVTSTMGSHTSWEDIWLRRTFMRGRSVWTSGRDLEALLLEVNIIFKVLGGRTAGRVSDSKYTRMVWYFKESMKVTQLFKGCFVYRREMPRKNLIASATRTIWNSVKSIGRSVIEVSFKTENSTAKAHTSGRIRGSTRETGKMEKCTDSESLCGQTAKVTKATMKMDARMVMASLKEAIRNIVATGWMASLTEKELFQEATKLNKNCSIRAKS